MADFDINIDPRKRAKAGANRVNKAIDSISQRADKLTRKLINMGSTDETISRKRAVLAAHLVKEKEKLITLENKLIHQGSRKASFTAAEQRAYSRLTQKVGAYSMALKKLRALEAGTTASGYTPARGMIGKDPTANLTKDDPNGLMAFGNKQAETLEKNLNKAGAGYKKMGNEVEKTSRRSSILNSRLGNFFVIMTGISGTIFVFQKLYQWVHDFTNVTMKAEEALVKLNMEASITKDMLTDIGQISKITGASGIIATEKATEKIQKYIQEGYSATESTQLLGQEISKLNTAYDGTLTGAMSRLKGIFVDIAATIGEKIRPGLTQLSKDVSTYQEREWQETFWENESRLQTSINQKKIGADFWMASKDRGKTVKQLQEALLDLRTKYFYEKDLREHNVGFDARELGNAGADIRANKSDAEYLKSLGKEWKKLKDDKVKYYGMTDYKKELAIHNKLYNSLRKLSEQNIAMRAEQDQWNQVEKAQIWMKYFKYPTDAISDHEKERLNLSDPRATTHDTTLAMRKFRDNQFKGLKEGEMSDHEKIRLGLKDLPIMSPTEIDKILDHIREKNKRTAEEMLADSRIWTDGVKRGLDDYATAATNAGKNAEITITNGFKNMEDALVEFVTKGKISFSGLVDSMLVDMARMAIRESITGPLAQGLSGALGAYFTPTAPNMNNITAQPGPRAAGGTVSPYTSYLVGEKGPELLNMGSGGGYVTPNNKLGSAPSVKVVVNNNTGTKAEVRQDEPRFNGQEWVIGVWLDAYTRNAHGLRSMLGG